MFGGHRPLGLLVVVSLVLAGCAASNDAPGASGNPDEAAASQDLHATDDTGVIRGVVVDLAIKPLGHVQIVARGGAKAFFANTTENGVFGMQGLPPGTYFLKANKPGYKEGQTSVDVVAGVDDPEVKRITLEVDQSNQPFYTPVVSHGYIECSVNAITVGVALCNAAGIPNDVFNFNIPQPRPPTHIQGEMIWKSSQTAGDALEYLWSYDCGAALLCNFEASGKSPQLIMGNDTIIHTLQLDNGTDLAVRVFAHWVDGTAPPPPISDQCQNVPLVGQRCTNRGIGFVFEQSFEIYTHMFYGYKPTTGWRFSSGQPVPAPPK